MTATTRQLAAALGISVQRINKLARKGKITREPDSLWNLENVRAQLQRSLDVRQPSPALRRWGKREVK